MKLNVQMIGTANVLRNISMWQKIKFPKEIKNALNLTRLEIENDARRMASKDTGALKASIWSKMKNNFEAVVGDGVYYGLFVEKGHQGVAPHPFLIPAFEIGKKKFEERMKEILK